MGLAWKYGKLRFQGSANLSFRETAKSLGLKEATRPGGNEKEVCTPIMKEMDFCLGMKQKNQFVNFKVLKGKGKHSNIDLSPLLDFCLS